MTFPPIMSRRFAWWVRLAATGALGVAAWSAGRFTAPAQVEERESVRVVYRERERSAAADTSRKVETRIVYRDRTWGADGGIREIEIERTGATTDTTHAEIREVTRDVEKTVEKRIEVRPDWRASVTAGASLREPLIPLAGPLVIGLQVERRIIGGVSAGVWVSTQGAVGGVVSAEW